MFAINVILRAKKATDVNLLKDLLTECGRLSRAESGCVRYEVCHSEDDPHVFMLIERWESEDAWKAHRNEKAFQEIYQPQVIPLVERTPHRSQILE